MVTMAADSCFILCCAGLRLLRVVQGSGGARNAHAKGVCQVEGCYADLKGLRDYHLRYKICEYHLKVGGSELFVFVVSVNMVRRAELSSNCLVFPHLHCFQAAAVAADTCGS
jgi:hypothetical protein